MLSLPHAAIGVTIATYIPYPILSIPLALISHFLADLIPHWNPHLDTEIKKRGKLTSLTFQIILLDLAAAIILIFYVSRLAQPNLIWQISLFLSGLGGILPDAVEFPHYFFGKKISPIEDLIHFQRHHQNHVGFIYGMTVQSLVVLLCFYLITLRLN